MRVKPSSLRRARPGRHFCSALVFINYCPPSVCPLTSSSARLGRCPFPCARHARPSRMPLPVPRWARPHPTACSSRTWRSLRSLRTRSEEHTSELQSRLHLVCRLLLEKKKKNNNQSLFLKKKKKPIN